MADGLDWDGSRKTPPGQHDSQPATPAISLQGIDGFSFRPSDLEPEPRDAGAASYMRDLGLHDPGAPSTRSATPGQGSSPDIVNTSYDRDARDAAASVSPAQLQGIGAGIITGTSTSTSASALNAPPKVGTRFSSGSVKVLRNWFATHERHPYPSPEDVDNLQNQTGLTRQQITNWLANCRRRSKFQTSRPASPHVRTWADPPAPGQAPIDIPPRRATPAPMELMNPMQRWENSPPEHEAAAVLDISRAVAASVDHTAGRTRSRTSGRSSGNASSVSSAGTSRSSLGSGSHASAYSHTSRNSLRSLDSLKRSANRRRRRATTKRQENNRLSVFHAYNTYQCTFCTETFKTKYDWQRHEKSLHLSLEEWICSPKGSTETHPDKGVLCVYCGDANPDQDHLNGHNHAACLERPFEERTFYRKDHLQQHLKLVHGTKYLKWPMESWQIASKEVRSRCGFCDLQLDTWTSRADHLAEHFKAGSTMANWKGDWGFEASVIEMLDNAMPPYLIHYEQNSPLPFSAIQGPADTPKDAYELIKLELEYHTRNYFDSHGEVPPDHNLQYEGCSIIFGAELISSSHPSSAPSWLRDIIMADHEIARRARIRPMKQVAKSRMSQLKINGKSNIFEGCELEAQLRRHVSMHATLDLPLSDYELQQEACNTVNRIEMLSPNPSKRFVEFITRLVWESTEWLAPLRERGQACLLQDAEGQAFDLGGMDAFSGQGFSADAQQGQFDLFQSMVPGAIGMGQAGSDQLGQTFAWPPTTSPSQAHTNTMTSGVSTPLFNPLPDASPLPGTSTPSLLNPPAAVPTASTLDNIADAQMAAPTDRWVPMPGTMFQRGDPVGQGIRHFLNDNNSYRRLARELSRFIATCMSPHNPHSHVPTDDELKYQARWILYDDDDPWNQTPVDNVEWLREFKRDVGLPCDDPPPQDLARPGT